MTLPGAFLTTPITHRALHGAGRPENSLAAVRAAVAAGYGIEIDVQPSADGVAMVFHDERLERLTGETGPIAARSAEALGQIPLLGGDEGIPTLGEVLTEVAGRVPLLVEIKDQSGVMGPEVGALSAHVAEALEGYAGPVAVMSFNPHAVAAFAKAAPDVPRGLTTCAWDVEEAKALPEAERTALVEMAAFDPLGACFISHDWRDLASPHVAEMKARGVPVLCWTIRSEADEVRARAVADNVTFEGYTPVRSA